jgi:hypothetical protein
MKKFQILLVLLVLSIAFSSCNPNDDDTTNTNNNTNFSENFGAKADRDFIGQVVDTNNQPIPNVAVKIGTSTVQTDMNGVFIINQANVNERFAYITAKKAGFIDGSRAMVPTNGKNNVRIMMIPNTPLATIQSGVASEVALSSGTKVVFDGAFETEAGVAYSGSVAVAMFHLAASNENISSLMPGMLYAQATDGSAKVLETFGMMQVELKGSAGQKLQIAKTHTAQINMTIDASQLATAPSSIPLWHFDEENGYWKQEGSATKLGNKYVGTVSHFSWWNCDAQFPTVTLTVKVVDTNGNPISNLLVGLTYFNERTGVTDNNGQVSGLIPANQTLTLNVYTLSQCSNLPINTMSIGPFSVNTVLPDIVLNSGAILTTTVQGNLLKCDNTNVTNGYVFLDYGNQTLLTTVTNGAFSFYTTYCNSATNFKLKGIDYENLQTTDSITYNFTTPVTNIGNLNACNTITEFISYKLDNNPTVFLTQNVGGGVDAGVSIYLSGSNQNNYLNIYGITSTPGTYTTSQFSIGGQGNNIYVVDSIINTMQFNLNSYGALGEFIDMTFNGTYNDPVGTHTLTGVAHVIRNN